MNSDNLRRSLPHTSLLHDSLANSTPLRQSLNQIPASPNFSPTSNSFSSVGLLLGAKPGSIVERHIGSTLGDVVRLTPLQTGILRRFLPDGFAEFLLGNNVVKLEPGYELRINETIAVRRRQELASRTIQQQEVHKTKVVILQQILANLICQDDEYAKKLKSLYTINDEVITAGYVMAVYPEGLVISANLSCPDDYLSWIFLGDQDLNNILVIDGTSADRESILRLVNDERARLERLLSLDAGMEVTFSGSDEPKTIESLWWDKGNVLGRKAVFDGGKTCVSILGLKPYHHTLKRKTFDSPPKERSFLRLYAEFQYSDLVFSICAFDERGVIANFKPPTPASGKQTNSRGRCWVPYVFFDKNETTEPESTESSTAPNTAMDFPSFPLHSNSNSNSNSINHSSSSLHQKNSNNISNNHNYSSASTSQTVPNIVSLTRSSPAIPSPTKPSIPVKLPSKFQKVNSTNSPTTVRSSQIPQLSQIATANHHSDKSNSHSYANLGKRQRTESENEVQTGTTEMAKRLQSESSY